MKINYDRAFLSKISADFSLNSHHDSATLRKLKRQQDIDKQKSTIDVLMQALRRIGEEKQQLVMVQDVASQVTGWGEQSDELARQNKLLPARQLLDQSLVAIKTAIAALRNNETLTRSLNFSNPKDEFDYEIDRFDTYKMLLQMMVLPKPELSDAQRVQIEQRAEQSDKLRIEADRQAAQGQFNEAIITLEMASQTLLKAIRIGGVYLPG